MFHQWNQIRKLQVYWSYFTLLTREWKFTTYTACHCISHTPLGSKCKIKIIIIKKISTDCCPDKICEFLAAAGRCNRHTESVPSTGSVVGRVTPRGKAQGAGSPGTCPSQVQSRQSLPGWASSLCSGAQENTRDAAAEAPHSAVLQALTSLHLPHSDRQTQPKGKTSTKPRGITFLEDDEHYACPTTVNRGIHIPHKSFLLLERYCKIVIKTHNWNAVYLHSIKAGTKTLIWLSKKKVKPQAFTHAVT